MVPIHLFDSLRFERLPPASDGLSAIELDVLSCYPMQKRPIVTDAPDVPRGKDNLVVRALELLRERSRVQFGARVQLVKRIPQAAGLGGGSSDAAAALRLANLAWELNWSFARLSELAGEIGSDVPFFLRTGAAVCRGRGERVEPVRGLPILHFVVVKPEVGLSTADVYSAHANLVQNGSTRSPSADSVIERIHSRRLSPKKWLRNRLQDAAATVCPWVERLRLSFDRLDFVGHQLSGSGSAYFGICRHAQHARRLASVLKSQQLGYVYATRSCA